MIELRHDIFITLVVTLCLVTLVTAEARYYPPKSILRGGNGEVLNILQRNNGNPEISTVLSDSPKPFAGGYPKAVIPIGNPAVETLLRDNSRAILRGGNPELSAMLRDNPKHFLLAVIPEISATPHDNPKPNPYSDKLTAMLREYTKPHVNNPAKLRVRKHSESENDIVPTSGINKYTIKDNDIKETFNRIIETVAKVNDERILGLKKFLELDNYLPQVSRTTQKKNPLIAIIMNTPNYKSNNDNLNINHLTEDPQYVIVKKKHKNPTMLSIFKEIKEGSYFNHKENNNKVTISQESDETPLFKNFYLRGWKGCTKNAIKYCQKACKKAFKYVCDNHRCEKSLKKDGKKQCKKKCKAEFVDDDDDEDSSSE